MSWGPFCTKNFHEGTITPNYSTTTVVVSVGTKQNSSYNCCFTATGYVIASNVGNQGKAIFQKVFTGITNYNGVLSLNPSYFSAVANNGSSANSGCVINGQGCDFTLNSSSGDQVRWVWKLEVCPNEP